MYSCNQVETGTSVPLLTESIDALSDDSINDPFSVAFTPVFFWRRRRRVFVVRHLQLQGERPVSDERSEVSASAVLRSFLNVDTPDHVATSGFEVACTPKDKFLDLIKRLVDCRISTG